MSNFQDVTAGENWKPEPAARYNAVNQLLRDNAVSSAGTTAGNKGGNFYLRAVNSQIADDQFIVGHGYWIGAVGTSGKPARTDAAVNVQSPYEGYNESNMPWGILIDRGTVGNDGYTSYGTILISGVVIIPYSLTGDGGYTYYTGCFTLSGRDYVKVSQGRLRVLGAYADGYVCYLSPPAEFLSAYNGAFKLTRDIDGRHSVVYGPDPSANFCGFTDIPGYPEIPKVTLDDGYVGTVYLWVKYDVTADKYTVGIGALPADQTDLIYEVIGGIRNNGTFTQTLRVDTLISFGREYFL